MQKKELARRIALKTQRPEAKAADHLDQIIHEILKSLRSGNEVSLPGLGTFRPSSGQTIEFSGLPEKGSRKEPSRPR